MANLRTISLLRKWLAGCLCLLGLAWPGSAAASSAWPAPVRYGLSLRYLEAGPALSGVERIAFVNDGPRPLRSVWVRVWANAYGSCRRPRARLTVLGSGRAAEWAARCTALRIRLPAAVPPGGHGRVVLRLRVTLPDRPNRFGQDARVAYFGNALPLLDVQGPGGPDLDPYTDLGDPFYSRSADWAVRLDVPAGEVAATTGVVSARRRVGGAERLSIVASRARDFAIVAGPLLVERTRGTSGVLLRRYRLRGGSRSQSLRTLAVARAAVDSFESWFGPLQEREVDILPGPSSLGEFGQGMEFPGLVLTADSPRLVAHELAHEWFYGLVGDDQWRAPWLDESFAEFASRRLPPEVVGADDLSCDRSRPVPGPLTASMGHWDAAGARAYYGTVYLGGACALRSLEADLGAGWMTSFLRSYVKRHRYGLVTTAAFVEDLRAAAPAGYDVDAFLRQARIEGAP